MATQVRETSAGKSVSAYIILKRGRHVATVNAHFSNGGRVTVDVWNVGDNATVRCLEAALESGALSEAAFNKAIAASKIQRNWGEGQDHEGFAAYDLFGLQQGSAGGYGYDKFAAAISRLWIDGVQLTDHCGRDAASEKLLSAYNRDCERYKKSEPCEGQGVRIYYDFPEGFRKRWDDKAKRIGAHFANFNGGKYGDLYISAGLDRLTNMGYDIIQAI